MLTTLLSLLVLAVLCILVARACQYDYDDWPDGEPPATRTEGTHGAWGQPTTEAPADDGPPRAA